jgi:hypothetical protein
LIFKRKLDSLKRKFDSLKRKLDLLKKFRQVLLEQHKNDSMFFFRELVRGLQVRATSRKKSDKYMEYMGDWGELGRMKM